MALRLAISLLRAGQTSTHTPQPVQSSSCHPVALVVPLRALNEPVYVLESNPTVERIAKPAVVLVMKALRTPPKGVGSS